MPDETRASVIGPPLPPERTLPFAPPASGSVAGRTMQESTYSPKPPEYHLPPDAPNVLIVLIDDAGPALPTTLGGAVRTPTLDRVRAGGVGYNRFHTTAMCSPTRASLLTGRNHHRVGNGQIAELANDWDGYSGHIPKSSATMAEVLRQYGYATGAWGKWHNTPAEETTVAGPFDRWPTGYGFEYTSTGSSPARHPSTNPTWCATPRRCCRPRRPRRATTSARTSPTTRWPGCATTRP
ncbi:sulfatase-like hydrolase/transferase [Agromyces sp. NPDC056523]|uniref:sulfatase-like hydrolase/transferase n=1 Tax=Agromyces sp. NPDC056523 TaxID=3345850 RepID=UPI00366E86D3